MRIAASVVDMSAKTNFHRKETASIKQSIIAGQKKMLLIKNDISKSGSNKTEDENGFKPKSENKSVNLMQPVKSNSLNTDETKDPKIELMKRILAMINGIRYKPEFVEDKAETAVEKYPSNHPHIKSRP